jgi:hypothetical protein
LTPITNQSHQQNQPISEKSWENIDKKTCFSYNVHAVNNENNKE